VPAHVAQAGEVEIAAFGVRPDAMDCGYDGAFLTEIVRRAWRLVSNGSEGFGRVRLSTSSWDHPHALANYLARGFRVTAVVLQRHEAGTEHRHAVPVDGPPRFLVRPAVAADARPVAGLLDELGYPLPIEGVGTPVAAARRID
jgi:hypothetical protein